MNKLYWHAYHAKYLCFVVDYDERLKIIKETKPVNEQADRKRWFKKVKGELPKELFEAGIALNKAVDAYNKAVDAYKKAGIALNKAWDAYKKAWDAYKKVYKKHRTQIEDLHAEECPDCTWDGEKLIFKEATQ